MALDKGELAGTPIKVHNQTFKHQMISRATNGTPVSLAEQSFGNNQLSLNHQAGASK